MRSIITDKIYKIENVHTNVASHAIRMASVRMQQQQNGTMCHFSWNQIKIFSFLYSRLVTPLHSSSDSSTFVYTRLHSSSDSSVFLE